MLLTNGEATVYKIENLIHVAVNKQLVKERPIDNIRRHAYGFSILQNLKKKSHVKNDTSLDIKGNLSLKLHLLLTAQTLLSKRLHIKKYTKQDFMIQILGSYGYVSRIRARY